MNTNFNTEEKLAEFEVIDAQEEAVANEAAAEVEAEMFNDDADTQELAAEKANESLVDEVVQDFAI